MKDNFLFSSYQVAYYKPHPKKSKVNDAPIENIIDRNFLNRSYMEVLISDLTFIKIYNRTAYICFISDLFNREIVGYAVGYYKTPYLVLEAFKSIEDLSSVKFFHTDRGSEFKNGEIDELLAKIGIKRSLSEPGCPYDNACAESLFRTAKIEFVKNRIFKSLDQVKIELFQFVWWYNQKRLHSSLGYLSPITYKKLSLGI